MEVFMISIVLVGLAFIGLGVGVFFLPARKFPETEVGHNKQMRELGITCAKCEEKRAWNKMRQEQKTRLKPAELKIDFSQLK